VPNINLLHTHDPLLGDIPVSKKNKYCTNTLKPKLIQAGLTKVIQVTLNKHSLNLTREQVSAVTVVEMDKNKRFITIFILRVYNADLCLQLSIFRTSSKQTQTRRRTRRETASDVKKKKKKDGPFIYPTVLIKQFLLMFTANTTSPPGSAPDSITVRINT
jgi:hypothetical protein